ncbi:protein ELYS [Thrips palmi]|uniref:Protein ELYS n=1 Tax=Thrips palmi TaxID=161013 RepID=A0A6P8YYB7_THRPL|nr:protein ELYS [Thrips palmi]
MQSDRAPCNATGQVEFSAAVTHCLRDQRDEATPLLGGILSDSKLAWLSKGPQFEVVQVSDGAKIAAWTFGAVVRDFKTKVTCVAELPHLKPSGQSGPIDQIVVGSECELTGGMLCLFSLAGSRILRAINIPSKVTALTIVSLGGKATGPLHQCFSTMSGIAAVGTNDGQVLLIDLRRNECDEALKYGHLTHWEGIRDELQPCGLLSLKTVDANLLEEYPHDHLYLHLNEKHFLKHQRLVVQFRDCDAFMPDDPTITSLLHVPQLASLCVGFAFGSFQIWSLESLSLVYTLPLNEPNPVVQLSFQEACDDPNAYCYLWAVRGGLSRSDPVGDLDHPVPVFGPPAATMFSLCYDEKVWIQDYGHLYKRFMICSTGFELDLCVGNETVGGRLISLYSASRGMVGSSAVQSPPEDSSSMGPSSNAISLCLIVWETWGPTGPSSSVNPVNTHMTLFDINQWYVDQMPSSLPQRGGPSRHKSVASYLVSYDLGSAVSASGGLLLDVRVNPNSLVQFSSVQNVEEFTRPSSLSFLSEVLMERQVVHVRHEGVQRALLSNLVSSGPGALMTPSNLFHECLALGLRPLLMDVSRAINVPVDEQRTFVLCVALEQRLGRFVCRCAREWADGRLSAAGCTMSWLLSVAWNRAAVLKQLAIRICAQLFDHSGEKLENSAQRQLQHIVGVFHLLETLFENVVQNKWHLALNEWPQVNLQNDALKLECQYYDVLQWLVDVELLPEGLNPAVPYPAHMIASFYHSRRLELNQLLQQQKDNEALENLEDLLLIDGLIRKQPGGVNVFSEWERDAGTSASPGSGRYPPVSIQALLRTFLIKDVALEVKHSIVIYVLMDLANILDNEQYQTTLQNFMKFPAAFSMSIGNMRLIQAFWHLDHKAFDTALDMLLDPLVSVRDIVPWQHRCIIRSLTLQGQANMALRYVRARRPPLQEPSDIKLHLNLLLANDLIDEAFMYQRNHRTDANFESLLSQFFQGCEERNHLRTVLQFSLDDEEEVTFSRYLETSRHPAADDLRVLYLLKRSRYVEALDVNQDLRKKGRSGGTRDVVVNGFYKTLPSVTRKLAVHCAQQQTKLKSWSQVEKPTPLFVNLKAASPQMRYKSSLLEAAVEKSRETWAKLISNVPPMMSEVESTPFLCTPRTKLPIRSRPASALMESKEQSKVGDRKRFRDEDEETMDGSFRKRSRFQNLESALAELQHQERQKTYEPRYSCADTLVLLNTPVVQRRSPSSRAKLQQQMIASSPGHSTVTPQSIIKVRQTSASRSESPKRRAVISATSNDPELTEEDSESEPFAKTRTVNKGESETDSEPGDEEEVGPVGVGVTARRIIDFDSDLSSDLSVSVASESPTPPPKSPSKSCISNLAPEKSLSRMVVLSEARKAGKSGHSVTFGKGSICVYDQDEPVDSEVAVQDESSNDTVDQEPCRDESPVMDDDSQESENQDSSKLAPSDISTFRPLRLETSGIGSMTASDIQEDLSCTEDSEVFLSADSSAQGTMYSPTFRHSLARPSVREITQRVTGTKRTQHDDSDSDDANSQKNNSDRVQQVRKSARLEDKSHSASLSAKSLGDVRLVPDNVKDTKFQTTESCSESSSKQPVGGGELSVDETSVQTTTTHLTSGSLTRPPIRSSGPGHSSVGAFNAIANDSTETTDVLELYSAQSISYEVSVQSQENVAAHLTEDAKQEIRSSSPEKAQPASEEKEENTVLVDTTLESNSSVEIVSIDDESDDITENAGESNVGKESESSHSSQEDENSDCGELISENSNEYFRSSHIDYDEESSLDSGADSSQSKQDVENLVSDDSESETSRAVTEVSEAQISTEGMDLNTAGNIEPEVSEESAGLNDACAMESEDISTSVHELEEDTPHHESITMAGALVHVEPETRTDETFVHLEKSTVYDHQLTHVEVACRDTVDLDHDDMPKLRLEPAASTENLSEMPHNSSDTVALLVPPSVSSPLEVMQVVHVDQATAVVASEERNIQNTNSLKSSRDYSPSPQKVSVNVADTPSSANPVEPATPKSARRRATARRLSVSSSKSESFEDDVPTRRVTRSHQKTIPEVFEETEAITNTKKTSRASASSQDGSKNAARNRRSSLSSVTSEATEDLNVPETRTLIPEVLEETEATTKTKKTARASASSQGGSKNAARNRQSSVSSVSSEATEELNIPEIKTRKRRNSTSSQASVAESANDVVAQDKLDKISEEGSEEVSSSVVKESKNIETTSTSKPGLKTPRRRRTSEQSSSALEDQVKPSEGHSESGSSNAMETYETSRRLTRHQRALLAKSIEMNSAVSHASLNRPSQVAEVGNRAVPSDDEDDKMSVCSVRSSQRLRAKSQQQELLDSPSSTASTVINPALTPTVQRRRRQSMSSDFSEINRDASPVSSVRRRKSIQPGTPTSLSGTPTRRSSRICALQGVSQQSEDGDNHSVASMSPSSIASGRKSSTKRSGRRLSISSEAPSEQYAFAPPQVEHANVAENPDVEMSEDFVFSPPKTVATPSKSRSSSSDLSSSASKKSTRQSKTAALQTIKEESSVSRVSEEDTVSASPVRRSGRPSWNFVEPTKEGDDLVPEKPEPQTKTKKATRGYHTTYPLKKISLAPIPQITESEDSNSSTEAAQQVVKTTRTTRQSASSRKQKK